MVTTVLLVAGATASALVLAGLLASAVIRRKPPAPRLPDPRTPLLRRPPTPD
jgi:hypothetical protein